MLGSVALHGAGAADQPDTELLDAEPLASELTSATIFWRFNAKLPSASPEAKLLRFLLLIWLNFVGGSLRGGHSAFQLTITFLQNITFQKNTSEYLDIIRYSDNI